MNRISFTKYYIEIVADSNDSAFCSLIQTVQGIEKTRYKDTYRCSLHLIVEVLAIMRGITNVDQISDPTVKHLFISEMDSRIITAGIMNGTEEDLIQEIQREYPFLWPHQVLGVALAEVNNRYNFFYETRTGKTLMAFAIMHRALKYGRAKRCIVFCPSAIIQSWLNDAKDHFPELKVAAFYGDDKQKEEALHTPSHIVIWSTGMVTNRLEMLKAYKFDKCFFDESSKLKDYKAKLSESALDLSQTIPSWYNLSATPAPNGEHEYYTQMRTVDLYSFSPQITYFRQKYFDDVSRDKKYCKLQIKPDMKDAFYDKVKQHSLYVDQSVMKTAGKEWHLVNYDMDAESWQQYKTMAKEAYAEVDGQTLTALQAAAVRAKLNQITSGFILDTVAKRTNADNRKLGILDEHVQEVYCLGNNTRIKCLDNILQQLGDQHVIIWANYREEFRQLEELLGSTARYINGNTDVNDKLHYVYDEFKQHKVQYLVCHPLSLGMGLNLTEAHSVVYYSLNDSWEAMHQSSQRVYGQITVQPYKCDYYVINARGTINEVIYDNVQAKRDSSTGVLNHLRAVSLLGE